MFNRGQERNGMRGRSESDRAVRLKKSEIEGVKEIERLEE